MSAPQHSPKQQGSQVHIYEVDRHDGANALREPSMPPTGKKTPSKSLLTIKRAAIYARVSTHIQEEEGTSLESQVEDGHAYAKQQGYLVADEHVFKDVHTGTEYRERKALTRLREAMRQGAFTVVVVYDVDRLSRSTTHLAVLLDEAEHLGVSVEFIKEKFDDTPQGKFIRQAKGFVGEIEREKIIERSQRGRIARAQAGKLVPSRKPLYGYQFNADRTAYIIDPKESIVVRRVFQIAVDGWTQRAITRQLNDEGIPSPEGKSWHHCAILRILKERQYTGEAVAFRYIRTKVAGKYTTAIKRGPEEDHIKLPEGTVPQLVDFIVFEKVQEQLRFNKAQATRNNQRPEMALLRGGYAKCGYCGHNMTVRAPTPTRHAIYQCSQGYSVEKFCHRHGISAPILDEAVWRRIVEVVEDPSQVLQKIEDMKHIDPIQAELAPVERTLKQIELQQERLLANLSSLDPLYAGHIRQELNNLAEEQRRLEKERHQLMTLQADWEETQRELKDFEQWCRNFAQGLGTHTYEEKRRACRMLGVQVSVWGMDHSPRYKITMSLDIVVRSA